MVEQMRTDDFCSLPLQLFYAYSAICHQTMTSAGSICTRCIGEGAHTTCVTVQKHRGFGLSSACRGEMGANKHDVTWITNVILQVVRYIDRSYLLLSWFW